MWPKQEPVFLKFVELWKQTNKNKQRKKPNRFLILESLWLYDSTAFAIWIALKKEFWEPRMFYSTQLIKQNLLHLLSQS